MMNLSIQRIGERIGEPMGKRVGFLWLLFALAGLSFATTLPLQYVGEEAVYTLSSLEMHHYQETFRPLLYGTFYQRPPMFNWVMMTVANVIGWEYILVAARLVNACSTLLTALLIVFFTQRLSQNRQLALLAGLCFFSFDILFRRGWLAYADSLFAFFTFAAIVCLWIALDKRQIYLFLIAMLSLVAAFLTKALTAYVFYAVSALVLLIRHPNGREILLNPFVIFLHIVGFSFPLIWNAYFSQGAHSTSMVMDILAKFQTGDSYSGTAIWKYLKGLVAQPTEILLRLSPASLIALYLVLRKRVKLSPEAYPVFVSLLWITGLNYIPYAIAPIYSMRYILPLYPFIAIIGAYLIWFSARRYLKFTISCFILLILLKYIAGIWWFPHYENTYRGNYAQIAQDISSRTQAFPLYANSTIAITLSVVANIDRLRFPKQPITFPPANWKAGFVISETPQSEQGANAEKVVKKYQLGREQLYLICKGAACA